MAEFAPDVAGGTDHFGQHRDLAAAVELHDGRLNAQSVRLAAVENMESTFLWWLYGLSVVCAVLLALVITALL